MIYHVLSGWSGLVFGGHGNQIVSVSPPAKALHSDSSVQLLDRSRTKRAYVPSGDSAYFFTGTRFTSHTRRLDYVSWVMLSTLCVSWEKYVGNYPLTFLKHNLWLLHCFFLVPLHILIIKTGQFRRNEWALQNHLKWYHCLIKSVLGYRAFIKGN